MTEIDLGISRSMPVAIFLRPSLTCHATAAKATKIRAGKDGSSRSETGRSRCRPNRTTVARRD